LRSIFPTYENGNRMVLYFYGAHSKQLRRTVGFSREMIVMCEDGANPVPMRLTRCTKPNADTTVFVLEKDHSKVKTWLWDWEVLELEITVVQLAQPLENSAVNSNAGVHMQAAAAAAAAQPGTASLSPPRAPAHDPSSTTDVPVEGEEEGASSPVSITSESSAGGAPQCKIAAVFKVSVRFLGTPREVDEPYYVRAFGNIKKLFRVQETESALNVLRGAFGGDARPHMRRKNSCLYIAVDRDETLPPNVRNIANSNWVYVPKKVFEDPARGGYTVVEY